MKKLLPLFAIPPQNLRPGSKEWGDWLKSNVWTQPDIPKPCRESQKRAMERLIMQAWDVKRKPGGDSSWGDIPVDAEQWLLSELKASGTVHGTFFLPFVRSLSEEGSPYFDEARLNHFLIKVGGALKLRSKRRELPDWSKGVDKTMRYIVHGWCDRITVDREEWPPLCCLATPALAEFLRLCQTPKRDSQEDPRTLEARITRLGLLRIPRRRRIRHVRKQCGQFCFA